MTDWLGTGGCGGWATRGRGGAANGGLRWLDNRRRGKSRLCRTTRGHENRAGGRVPVHTRTDRLADEAQRDEGPPAYDHRRNVKGHLASVHVGDAAPDRELDLRSTARGENGIARGIPLHVSPEALE